MKAKKVFALFCAIAMVTGTAVTVPAETVDGTATVADAADTQTDAADNAADADTTAEYDARLDAGR